jgi:hypothetical protein
VPQRPPDRTRARFETGPSRATTRVLGLYAPKN